MSDIYAEGQKEKNAQIKEIQRLAKQREMADLKSLLKLPTFRRFCWRKWTEAKIFNNPYVPDSDLTVFNSGFKQSGLDLLAEVNEADPAAFPSIQREYVSEKNSKQEKNS